MVTPLWFHVHAKPCFTTLTMNNTLATEILKRKGGISSPYQESGEGQMPEMSEIKWAELSYSQKEYLGLY